MKCPTCELINPDTALRCDCGYNFQNGRMEQPYEDAKTPAVARIASCPRCGAQNQTGAAFCQACGFSLSEPVYAPARRATKPLSTGAIIFLGIFGCLILSWISSWIRGDKGPSGQTGEPTPTLAASKDPSDYEKVVHNELGRMTIKATGGSITSIRLDTLSEDQKQSP